MTPLVCANGCGRPPKTFGKVCRWCLAGDVPQPDPKLCSNSYLESCVLELIRRGALNPLQVKAAQEAARNLGSAT